MILQSEAFTLPQTVDKCIIKYLQSSAWLLYVSNKATWAVASSSLWYQIMIVSNIKSVVCLEEPVQWRVSGTGQKLFRVLHRLSYRLHGIPCLMSFIHQIINVLQLGVPPRRCCALKKPESNATLPSWCTHPFFILIPVSHCWISEVATPVLKHLASSAGSKQVTSFELTVLLAEVS